jgi:hypothetical protein
VVIRGRISCCGDTRTGGKKSEVAYWKIVEASIEATFSSESLILDRFLKTVVKPQFFSLKSQKR